MRYYPLLADLTTLHCLVVGTGEVGLRKIEGLLACAPAQVVGLDPAPPSPQQSALLARHSVFTYAQRPFDESDLDGMHLVFACTAACEVNARIGRACRQRNILCNIADDPEQGTFVLPASITRGDLTITVSTSGASPALSRIIRQDLEQRYGPEYAGLTRFLALLRPALLGLGHGCSENRDIFRAVVMSSLPELIKSKNRDACLELLHRLLPTTLHSRIGEWCDDCFQTF
ncbi:MAG: bifunctional precorrin-2 dehydrogenase/sirohydrochlorin ferrochelatase [Desulfovibrionales bacterium]|nr:bifunctional precorrin-2 dehydrogenase/sirohydrochlorin ferrochelatase [Desulfovibrionales bacterium]